MTNENPLHPSFPRTRESSLIEQAWLDLANQRLNDIENKRVKTIPWADVSKTNCPETKKTAAK